jgi:hypothetical protein
MSRVGPPEGPRPSSGLPGPALAATTSDEGQHADPLAELFTHRTAALLLVHRSLLSGVGACRDGLLRPFRYAGFQMDP